MKQDKALHAQILGVLKDSFVIILLFVSFCFIDIGAATLITVICTALLLIRRIILNHNPLAIKGYNIHHNEKELNVPKGVYVFDLRNVPSMEYLYKYIEVMRVVSESPKILIIRFVGIIQIKKFEINVLKEVLHRLKKSKVTVILSDVEENVRHQFKEYEIANKVGTDNIFYTFSDSLMQADNSLKQALLK